MHCSKAHREMITCNLLESSLSSWVYVTSKSPLSSLVVHTLKSMWIRGSKRLCGNLQRSGTLARPVESNFLFFTISLESEYNC